MRQKQGGRLLHILRAGRKKQRRLNVVGCWKKEASETYVGFEVLGKKFKNIIGKKKLDEKECEGRKGQETVNMKITLSGAIENRVADRVIDDGQKMENLDGSKREDGDMCLSRYEGLDSVILLLIIHTGTQGEEKERPDVKL
nr:hypothetical protein [Tanacetum cinerariifolium]